MHVTILNWIYEIVEGSDARTRKVHSFGCQENRGILQGAVKFYHVSFLYFIGDFTLSFTKKRMTKMLHFRGYIYDVSNARCRFPDIVCPELESVVFCVNIVNLYCFIHDVHSIFSY